MCVLFFFLGCLIEDVRACFLIVSDGLFHVSENNKRNEKFSKEFLMHNFSLDLQV